MHMLTLKAVDNRESFSAWLMHPKASNTDPIQSESSELKVSAICSACSSFPCEMRMQHCNTRFDRSIECSACTGPARRSC